MERSWQKLALRLTLARDREGPQEWGSNRVILGWVAATDLGRWWKVRMPPSRRVAGLLVSRFPRLSSLFLFLLPVSHTTLSQLPSDLSGARVWPQSAGAGGPRPQGAHRALSPSFFSLLERREPRRNRPRSERSRVGGQISLAFDRSFPIRSGFLRPVTALPHPPGSRSSPAGSRFAGLRLAPPEGFPSAAFRPEPAPPLGLWGGSSPRGSAPVPSSSRSPPHCCFRSSTCVETCL